MSVPNRKKFQDKRPNREIDQAEDQGFQLTKEDGHVILRCKQPVNYIAFTPDQAAAFAHAMKVLATDIINEDNAQ